MTTSNPGNLAIENDAGKIPPAVLAEGSDSREEQATACPDSTPIDNSTDNSVPNNDVKAPASQESEQDEPIPSGIKFRKKGENGTLLSVTIEPGSDFPDVIPIKTIQSWIRQQGCESWQQDEEIVSRFAREAHRLKESKEYVFAERKDCCIEVKVSQDRLNAWIIVSQAFGGEPFSEALFKNALEADHIRFGIKEEAFQEIQRNGWCEKRLIAEGKPPIEGQKAKFEPLVIESDHKGVPQEREDGRVDYKDLGLYLSVTPGTPLLRHIPPIEGAPGTGIDGEPIPAPQIRDRNPHPGVGTAISPDDPDIIVATRSGKPYFDDNSVRVDPTLEIDTVDPSTGNVIFDGNIIVRGSVEAGFTIQAGQDLTILDTVEGADLTAGKNLTLVTGVYGRGRSTIRVKGKLEARFLSDCSIQCGGNIEVSDLMSHCFVECEGVLSMGKLGGKGQIIGGNIRVLQDAQAQIIGSVSEITTRIEVGPSKGFILKIEKIQEEITLLQEDLQQVEKVARSLRKQDAAKESTKFKELKAKGDALNGKLGALKEEKEALQKKLDSSRKGRIRAGQVYRGAVLSVGVARQSVSDLTTDFNLYQPSEETHQPAQNN
jgi:uncharacterized protein (DUF342 family)